MQRVACLHAATAEGRTESMNVLVEETPAETRCCKEEGDKRGYTAHTGALSRKLRGTPAQIEARGCVSGGNRHKAAQTERGDGEGSARGRRAISEYGCMCVSSEPRPVSGCVIGCGFFFSGGAEPRPSTRASSDNAPFLETFFRVAA